MRKPEYGDAFWLVPTKAGVYDPGSYASSNSGKPGSVYIPWKHLVQHLYDYFTDLQIKEAHTFWSPGTTEPALLDTLVAELNKSGSTGAILAWKSAGVIKTFFPGKPASPTDKYTGDQISDVCSVLT